MVLVCWSRRNSVIPTPSTHLFFHNLYVSIDVNSAQCLSLDIGQWILCGRAASSESQLELVCYLALPTLQHIVCICMLLGLAVTLALLLLPPISYAIRPFLGSKFVFQAYSSCSLFQQEHCLVISES